MVIHFIHHAISAKRFVEPIVEVLNTNDIEAGLWIEPNRSLRDFQAGLEAPVRYCYFDMCLNPARMIHRLYMCCRRIRQANPQAVHAHQTRAALVPLLAACLVGVGIRIYHNHGTPYLGYRGIMRAVLWLIEKINCALATHVLTVSPSIRRHMINDRLTSAEKCQVLGHGSAFGINLMHFAEPEAAEAAACRDRLGIPRDAFVVLFVGRPFRRKGFHVLLESWRQVGTRDNDLLLLAGCSQEDVVAAMGCMPPRVRALGRVLDPYPCYAACDVVVLPSFHEGLSYCLLEGAAAAKPLICSEIPGLDALVRDGYNGLLIGPGDTCALGEAICRLRDNADLRRQLGANARRTAEEKFDRALCRRALLTYYEAFFPAAAGCGAVLAGQEVHT